MNQRMFPLTLPGLEGAMRLLVQMSLARQRRSRALWWLLARAARGGCASLPFFKRQGRGSAPASR